MLSWLLPLKRGLLKHESMYGLLAGTKKLVVAERWPLTEIRLYFAYYTYCFLNFLAAMGVVVVVLRVEKKRGKNPPTKQSNTPL